MSSTPTSNSGLAHSQTPPAIPPSTTDGPDMPGASEETEESREEQLNLEQKNTRQPETLVVDQATEGGTPKREDSLETDTPDISSTPVTSSNLLEVATPRSSMSPELEATQSEADLGISKRSHADMAGPSPYESRKVARLSESLSDTQDVDNSFVAGPSDDQTPKTNKRSHIASAGSDGEDEEEPPTKKRRAREARVTRDSSPAESVKEANVMDHPTLSESFLDLETPGSTIYSNETVDPRRRPPQPPVQSDQKTATTPSQPPPPKSYLHTLPGELRNRIYLHLGLRSGRLDLNNIAKPALIVAYPDLKDELLSVMLSDNKLSVPVYSDYRIKASEAPSHSMKRSSVGPFEVGTLAIVPRNWIKEIDPHFVTIKHIRMRIWEAPEKGRTIDSAKLICEYFLNVRTTKGKPTTVSHMTKLWATTATKRESRSMCDLATARAKRLSQQDGFIGFTWEQAQELAGSFASVLEAKSHFTKVRGKVVLNEQGVTGDLA